MFTRCSVKNYITGILPVNTHNLEKMYEFFYSLKLHSTNVPTLLN